MYTVTVIITGHKPELDSYLSDEFASIKNVEIISWGVEGIMFTYVTDNTLFVPTYTRVLLNYPSFFIKVTWTSISGMSGMSSVAGILVGNKNTGLRTFSWNDLTAEEEAVSFRSH